MSILIWNTHNTIHQIWNHPDVLQEVVSSSKVDDLDVDLPRASTKLALDWAKDELVGMRRGVIEDGAKMMLLIELIEESVAIGDKVHILGKWGMKGLHNSSHSSQWGMKGLYSSHSSQYYNLLSMFYINYLRHIYIFY